MQHLQNLGKKVKTVFKEVFGMTQENVDNTPLVADEVVAPVEEEPMVDEVVAEVVAEEVVEEEVAEVVESGCRACSRRFTSTCSRCSSSSQSQCLFLLERV